MYLKTLENLAAEHHELLPGFEAIDKLLAGNPKVLLEPNDVVNASGLSSNKSQSVLNLSVREGILAEVEFIECRKCHQLLKLEATECSQCESSKISKDRKKFWRLSEIGKKELNQSSGYLAGFHWSDDLGFYKGKVDAIIMTIKPEEFDSVLKRFAVEHTVVGHRHYNFCRVKSLHGQTYLVAVTRAIEQGEGESQNLIRDAIEDLKPGCVLVVGIAGAIPGELALGDVVFSTHVHDLTLSAIDTKGETFHISGGPMLKGVQTEVANLRVTLPKVLRNSKTIPVYPMLDLTSLVYTTEDEEAKALIYRKLEQRSLQRSSEKCPHFADGAIASSDRLIKEVDLIKGWKQLLRKVVAVEMEMAGAYRAVRGADKEYKLLSIRGISDVIGLKRAGDWEYFACEIAAEFALAFICSWKIPSVIAGDTSASSYVGAQKSLSKKEVLDEDEGINVYYGENYNRLYRRSDGKDAAIKSNEMKIFGDSLKKLSRIERQVISRMILKIDPRGSGNYIQVSKLFGIRLEGVDIKQQYMTLIDNGFLWDANDFDEGKATQIKWETFGLDWDIFSRLKENFSETDIREIIVDLKFDILDV